MKPSIAILISTCAMIIAWFLCPVFFAITEGEITLVNPLWLATYDNGVFSFTFLPSYFAYFRAILITGPSLIFVPEVARVLSGKSSFIEGAIVAILSISPIIYVLIIQPYSSFYPIPCVLLVGVICLAIFKSGRFSSSVENDSFITD